MKSLSDHAQKVQRCLNDINSDLKKHNFKDSGKEINQKMVNITIKNYCLKYGLKIANIKMVFEGRFEPEKKKIIPFNNF
jgi:hypothetical protein